MVGVRAKKRFFPFWTAVLICAAAAAGAVLFLLRPAPGDKPLLLGEAEGFSLRRGMPPLSGRTVTLAPAQWMQGTLMLASPQHPLPEDYPPPDTRAVRAVVAGYLPAAADVALRPEVIYALCLLQLDHPLQGKASLVRGALSFAQQEALRRQAYDRYARVYPLQEALERARAAVPGGSESEHQTGYAVDIVLEGPLATWEDNPLARSDTGKWLEENLWRYGFIQRYAPGHRGEGNCEGVHLRYVGPVHAAAMKALGLDLEDYLTLLHREGSLTLLRKGEPYAYIACQRECADFRLTVPENAAFQVSGDNTGWIVSAVAAQGSF